MYIEDRLFSESDPEEVLYSVTMTEDEYALYSEFQKEFGIAQKAIGTAKKVLKPIAERFNVNKFMQDAKSGVSNMISSYRKAHTGGLIDRSMKASEASGGGVFNTAREVAKNVWNKYKKTTPAPVAV